MKLIDLRLIKGSMEYGDIRKIAERLGIHGNTLSQKLKGAQPLTVRELNEVCRYHGVGVEYFSKEEDE